MRKRLGSKRVFYKNGVIAISAPVPATVLREYSMLELLSSPEELAAWVNRLLGLKPYEGVSRRHPGINRLSRWMVNRLTSGTGSKIDTEELLLKAHQWLPEFFVEGVEIYPGKLRVHRRGKTVEVETELSSEEIDTREREEEALDCLVAQNPKRRIRGLKLLAKIGIPDLFDWCVMLLSDDSKDVRVAALRTMLRCDEVEEEVILPLAYSEDKRIRAAAIAVLAKHSGENAPHWFERALKDKSACVRLETANLLSQLDTAEHQYIFELALWDPNPRIKHIARRLTVGKRL
ncbi:MAG: HEAT repeat domain-containing protein [Candidatus Poribacteria bacterium]